MAETMPMASNRSRTAASKAAAVASIDEQVFILFNELLRSRDRLAGLPPLTGQDFEVASQAMHEVVWFFLTPPPRAKTELALGDEVKAQLLRSSGDRSNDLYTMAVACIAMKLMEGPSVPTSAAMLDRLNDVLDGLVFDLRGTKKATLNLLREVREDIDARIAHVRKARTKGYEFGMAPERYRDRANRAEKPDAFFRRVYGTDVRRGLTQADVRKADPGFYNVLHVWCTRHGKRLSAMLPASRSRGH
jgi:hypothetical protein